MKRLDEVTAEIRGIEAQIEKLKNRQSRIAEEFLNSLTKRTSTAPVDDRTKSTRPICPHCKEYAKPTDKLQELNQFKQDIFNTVADHGEIAITKLALELKKKWPKCQNLNKRVRNLVKYHDDVFTVSTRLERRRPRSFVKVK